MAEKAKAPAIRFKGFTEDWEQREWVGTVDISTNMVDPKSGDYDELPHVAPGNIESFTGRLFDNVKTVKEENLISGKFHFYPGDVIYGKINPQLGKYVIATFEGLTSADAYVLNAKNGLDQKFLFTLLQTDNFYKYTVSVSKRSGMPKINREELNAYGFSVPKTIEQSQIGSLFLAFDNLITLHQRKLLKLKNVKTAMLEKMFPKNGSNVPEIRFAGFTDAWEQRKAIDIFRTTADKNHPDLPVLSATQEYGMILREDTGINISHDTENEATYKRVWPGQFVIHLRSFQGGFAHANVDGITSPAYTVMDFIEPKTHYDFFWKYIFSSGKFIKSLEKVTYGIRDGRSISYDDFSTMSFLYSGFGEQKAIGQLFQRLDHLITLHQRKLKKLQNVKKSMLEKMFV